MDAANTTKISDAILKVGESLIALSLAISTTNHIGGANTASTTPPEHAVPKKRAPRVHIAVPITEQLANFIGRSVDDLITRPEAEAAVMDYIRAHNLQDPSDKRKITPDEDLSQIFNHDDPITVLTLKGAIKHHFLTAP